MAITSLSVGWPCGSVVYAQTHTDMWLSYCSSLVFFCVKIPAIHTVVKNRALSWSLVCFQCFNAHLHVSKSQISSLSTSSIHTHTQCGIQKDRLNSHSLAHTPCVHNGQDWVGSEPGVRNTIWIFHRVAWAQSSPAATEGLHWQDGSTQARAESWTRGILTTRSNAGPYMAYLISFYSFLFSMYFFYL